MEELTRVKSTWNGPNNQINKMGNQRFLNNQSYINDITAEAYFEYKTKVVPSKVFIGDLNKNVYELLNKEFGKPEIAHIPLKFSQKPKVAPDYDIYSAILNNNQAEYRFFFYYFEFQNETFVIKTSQSVNDCTMEICSANLEKIFSLIKTLDLEKYKIQEQPLQIGILFQHNGVIMIKKIPLPDIEVNLEYNYGDEFIKIHNSIVNKLENKSHGLYLMFGEPGTGKSSYIKHLAKIVQNRMFVFVPTNQLEALVTPSLLAVLLEHKNIVLILEDAEKAIESREISNSGQSMVSTILNLSDGILGSLLNLAIIVTFNTKREKIDEALLRKGRLLVEHKFDKLSIQDSQRLLDFLKKDYKATEKMSLAEIYNVDDDNFHEKEKEPQKIGF